MLRRECSLLGSDRVVLNSDQVTVSNPAEVAKTRLQLQGELAQRGGPKVYRNVLDVFAKTWRNEGIRGVQRGLAPAVRMSCARTQLKPVGLTDPTVCVSSEVSKCTLQEALLILFQDAVEWFATW